jgi:hypothetical protein
MWVQTRSAAKLTKRTWLWEAAHFYCRLTNLNGTGTTNYLDKGDWTVVAQFAEP